MNFKTLLRISRPRFWHYVLGPILIYIASSGFLTEIHDSFMRWGTDRIFNLLFVFIVLWYFTLPANLWIYWRNDIADGDTDKFNAKKWAYEERIEDSDILKSKLKKHIWAWNIGYIVVGLFVISILMTVADCFPRTINSVMYSDILANPLWIIISWFQSIISYEFWLILWILSPFLLTSYLYSCNPLRAKAKPFIDGIMNILYIATPFTIVVAPLLLFSNYTNFQYIALNFLAARARVMAMHCYSAIPDIEPDKQAGLVTTAVYLGKQNSLLYCWVLYLLSAIFSFPTLWWVSVLWWIVYLTMIIVSYYRKDIFALYKLFPYINLIIWFLLFWYIILYS